MDAPGNGNRYVITYGHQHGRSNSDEHANAGNIYAHRDIRAAGHGYQHAGTANRYTRTSDANGVGNSFRNRRTAGNTHRGGYADWHP